MRNKRRKHRHEGEGNPSDNVGNNLILHHIQPVSETQRLAFQEFRHGKNLLLHGYAGTGKTFIAVYLSLHAVFNERQFSKLCVVRSAVPSRNQGFLPGNIREKTAIYEAPYQTICTELFGRGDAYDILKKKNFIEFFSTSYIRGITLHDCILFVDEVQNLNDQEINSIITRVGNNCTVILSGDFRQSDLINVVDKNGIHNLIKTVDRMPSFSKVEFGLDDICRSGIVKEYLIARTELGL